MKNIFHLWRHLRQQLRAWLLQRSNKKTEEDTHRRGVVLLVSFLIAFVLWFTASMRKTYIVVVDMPVQVVNIPPDKALATLPPSLIKVQFQGEGWQLLQIYTDPPPLSIDLSQYETEQPLDLLELISQMNFPGGVNVLSVTPRFIRLRLEPRSYRTVPIKLRGIIEPAPLYDFIEPPRLDPDTVVLSGAPSVIDTITFWPTEYIELRDIRTDLVLPVPLSDTLALLIQKNIEETTLYIKVALFTEAQREIKVIVNRVPPGFQVRLRPEHILVTYRTPIHHYEAVQQSEDFYATVSYQDISEDTTGTVTPVIHTPTGFIVRDLRYEPRRLEYFVIAPN